MKNLKSILTFCHIIRRCGYYNTIQLFNMTKVKDGYNTEFYTELYTGLSDKDSELQFRIGLQIKSGFFTYEVYDTVLQRPVACFSEASYISDTVMYDDWLSSNYRGDKFFVFDKNAENGRTEVFPSMEEDEHFQFLMMHNAPEYEHMRSAFQYIENVYPLLKLYRLCSLATYDSLDVDFSRHIPKTEVLEEVELQFPGMIKFYNKVEEHEKLLHYTDLP